MEDMPKELLGGEVSYIILFLDEEERVDKRLTSGSGIGLRLCWAFPLAFPST